MANTLTSLPTFCVDLLEELDRTFPPLCIREGQTVEAAHRYAGKRELIDFLFAVKARGDKEFPKR